MPDSHTPSPLAASPVVLLPSGRFFVRRISLDAEGDIAAQVELALESLSPFPPAQLFHGHVLENGGQAALIYATHRRNFTAEEIAAWSGATAVLPGFAPWLAPEGIPAAGLGWRQQGDSLEVVAWDGRSRLPKLILTRLLPPEENPVTFRAALLDEARGRGELPSGAPVRPLPDTTGSASGKNGAILLSLAGQDGAVALDAALLDQADVRDRTQLAEQRRIARRDLWLWRAFAAGLAGLAACLVLELGLLGGRFWLHGLQTLISVRSEAVAQIKSTQELANRVSEMSSQQLRPLEMLSLVNGQRPATITFNRVVTTGVRRLEIEAQTGTPAELREFESRLRAAADVDKVELRDPRSRDGQTSFVLEVSFKPGYLGKAGGA